MRTLIRFTAVAAAAAATGVMLLLTASPAHAHPLGNFSVNQYLGLVLRQDSVAATAVVDFAEIPTLQERPAVDSDANGTVTDAERAGHASASCAALADSIEARVATDRLEWTVSSVAFEYTEGTGGLDVSRLTCALTAPAALAADTTLSLTNAYLADRVGWREITARAEGVGLVDPPVPAVSVSDELRVYPDDLLSSALDVRSVALRVTAGPGSAAVAAPVAPAGSDPVTRWLSTVDRHVADLASGPLTPAVTVGAVLLALLLGAGHATLPGHGKTVLAAYLAGRAGRPRDALTVAGTVTLTHTGGVLILGLLISGGAALVGERFLGWLGLVSGVLVLAVGAGMLRAVLHGRAKLGHRHGHSARHAHSHAHDRHHPGGERVDHHGHDHAHPHAHNHSHARGHSHAHDDTDQHGHGHHHARPGHVHTGRLGLAGIGIAGGLVPSPSALVVLLAAVGLGRTAFGVLLVLAYGAGMSATLAGAGLLLLAVQRRLARATSRTAGATWVNRLRSLAARLGAATPAATAALVLAVGAGLALRAATAVV